MGWNSRHSEMFTRKSWKKSMGKRMGTDGGVQRLPEIGQPLLYCAGQQEVSAEGQLVHHVRARLLD